MVETKHCERLNMKKSTQAVWVDGKPPDSIVNQYREMISRIEPLNQLILNLAQHARHDAELEKKMLQNHALNSRLNEEFVKYFPMLDERPILRDLKEQRYWINESLLEVTV